MQGTSNKENVVYCGKASFCRIFADKCEFFVQKIKVTSKNAVYFFVLSFVSFIWLQLPKNPVDYFFLVHLDWTGGSWKQKRNIFLKFKLQKKNKKINPNGICYVNKRPGTLDCWAQNIKIILHTFLYSPRMYYYYSLGISCTRRGKCINIFVFCSTASGPFLVCRRRCC